MISAGQWRAYNEAVADITERARADVEARVLAWLGENPGASAAEARAASIRIMRELIGDWGRAASSLAAAWYDSQGREAGAKLDRAVTEVTYTDADIERVVRYQAEKYVAGDRAAFARSCGEYALDVAKRQVNATVLKNARRDRERGVRFARVTSGRNTCSFCLMLAGRGAVYWSRKTAGEFDHWHTHCSCKVVPGFSGNPHEVLVEGHDPRDADAARRYCEGLKGQGLPKAQRDALLFAYLDAHGIGGPAGSEEENAYADALDEGARSALKAFRKKKTVASYDESVGRFLSLLGKEYGIDLSGERYANRKGKVVAADPNGEELWVALKGRLSGQFLYATPEHMCPDMRTADGSLVEFKTPKSKSKMNRLLLDASRKYDEYPNESHNAVLSLLRLPDAHDAALDAAERFARDGSLDAVEVLGANGVWIRK